MVAPMRFLAYLVMTPIAAVILVIAYANREWVTIGLDPTGYTGLQPIAAPQYAALLAAMAIGVVAGGVSSWLGQSGRRRALREAEIENRRLRGELQAARDAGAPVLARSA
jgi:hypothetical protein